MRTLLLSGLLLAGVASAGETDFPAALRLDALRQPAPLLALDEGKTLADYRGRWVVLHFWATWCAPCVKELPSLDRLSERWKGRAAFFAIAIDEDGEASMRAFARRHDIHMPLLHVRLARAPESYWGWGVPITYIIDPGGQLVARAMGPREWDSAAGDRLLSGLGGVPASTAAER
ncbi:MAG: TlpA family protein disulfide reductase [Chromatiales bacterium]